MLKGATRLSGVCPGEATLKGVAGDPITGEAGEDVSLAEC